MFRKGEPIHNGTWTQQIIAYLPIKGILSDCGGIDSATINRNTVKASSTVTQSETFCPDTAGR